MFITCLCLCSHQQTFNVPPKETAGGASSTKPASAPQSAAAAVGANDSESVHSYKRTGLLDARCKRCGARDAKACALSQQQRPESDGDSEVGMVRAHRGLVRKASSVVPLSAVSAAAAVDAEAASPKRKPFARSPRHSAKVGIAPPP